MHEHTTLRSSRAKPWHSGDRRTRRMTWWYCVLTLALAGCATPPESGAPAEGARVGVELKRASLWVEDLDQAIRFYRDVLGFALEARGPLNVGDDSALWPLFNLPAGTPVERALFSSATEPRVLFVMAARSAPVSAPTAARSPALVVATQDLDALLDRARSLGFPVQGERSTRERPSLDTPLRPQPRLREQVVLGPGGQPVLVYEQRR